eukprot:488351_1
MTHLSMLFQLLSVFLLTVKAIAKLENVCTNDASNTNYGIDLGETLVNTETTSGEESTLLFALLGDFGALGDMTVIEKSNFNTPRLIGEALNKLMENTENSSTPLQFIVNVGDNFYSTGIRSISDPRFQETFNNPLLSIPKYVYTVLGNHDYEANAEGKDDVGTTTQIEFTTSPYNTEKNWCLPNYYYTFSYNVNNEFKIRFIALDTTSLIGSVYEGCLPNPETGEIYDYCVGDSIPQKQDQLNWLINLLEESQEYDYVAVYGHHFLVSRSEDGVNLKESIYNIDTGKDSCMSGDEYYGGIAEMREIANIIAQYDNVQLYMGAHGHVTEAFEGYRKWKDSSSMFHTLIGRQGRINDVICGDQRDINTQYNSRQDSDMIWTIGYGSTIPAFATVYVTKSNITLQLVGTNQEVLWSKSITKYNVNLDQLDEKTKKKDAIPQYQYGTNGMSEKYLKMDHNKNYEYYKGGENESTVINLSLVLGFVIIGIGFLLIGCFIGTKLQTGKQVPKVY